MLAILIALVFKTVDADDSVEEVFVIGREKTGTVYPGKISSDISVIWSCFTS